MSELILGYGEIGKAVREAICPSAIVLDIGEQVDGQFDVLHICFPYSKKFTSEVKRYMKMYESKHIIVYSTLPIGTCNKIDRKVVHSPVEGKHPQLASSIKAHTRWLGSRDSKETTYFTKYFKKADIDTQIVANSTITESLKLLSTSEYGVNLVFADYKRLVAEKVGFPYQLVKEWNIDYNELYADLGLDDYFQKFVLDAPNGVISGHCVTQNSRLLREQFPNELLDMIVEMEVK